MAVRTRKHVAVTIADATGTPITATLGPGPGDVKLTGMEQGGVEGIGVYNRGTFLEMVEGDQKQLSFSISIYHNQDLTAAASPVAGILKTNDFASGVTKDPGGVVWGVNVIAVVTRSAVTDTFTFINCRISFDYSEGKEGNMITITGTCYGDGSNVFTLA
jgi:hypothetical protein